MDNALKTLKPIKNIITMTALSPFEKLLCIVLYLNADNNGGYSIYTKDLAEEVGCSKYTLHFVEAQP